VKNEYNLRWIEQVAEYLMELYKRKIGNAAFFMLVTRKKKKGNLYSPSGLINSRKVNLFLQV